jgi:hypothetical protein
MTDKNDSKLTLPNTLEDGDIQDVSNPTRRSALASVGAVVAGAVFGAAVLSPSEAKACPQRTGRTDSDPSDGAGRGRTNVTDADPSDGANCGRGRGRRRTCTDQDSGNGSDPPNHPC